MPDYKIHLIGEDDEVATIRVAPLNGLCYISFHYRNRPAEYNVCQ